jgi:regulator of sigma E protease
MITFLVFLGTILVLVGTHEGGHFLASKLAGVYVKEFALGFGPKLLSFKKGETVYSIRAIPFGGYVRLAGEDGSEAPAGVPADRLLYNRPPLARFLTSLAGPAANLLMTLVVALVALWSIGTPILQVAELVPGGPASTSLRPGDRVLSISGRTVSNGEDVSRLIQAAAGGPVEFRIRREREVETVTIVPAFDDAEARYLVGAYFLPITFTNEIRTVAPGSPLSLAGLRAGDRIVAIDGEGTATGVGIVNRLDRLLPLASVSLRVERKGEVFDVAVPAASLTVDRLLAGVSFADLGVESRRPGLLAGLVLGAGQFAADFDLMVQSIQGILTGRIAASEAVSGPIGIAHVLGEGVAQGPSVFLRLFSLLSLSLGLFNLIPFPALDGSRAVFALYELIRRRRIPPEREGMIHAIGFLILIGLMILVTYQDILKLFR